MTSPAVSAMVATKQVHSNHTTNVCDPKGSRLYRRALLEIGRPISNKNHTPRACILRYLATLLCVYTTHVCIFIAFVTCVGEIGRTLQNSVRHKDLNFIPPLLNKMRSIEKTHTFQTAKQVLGFDGLDVLMYKYTYVYIYIYNFNGCAGLILRLYLTHYISYTHHLTYHRSHHIYKCISHIYVAHNMTVYVCIYIIHNKSQRLKHCLSLLDMDKLLVYIFLWLLYRFVSK